MKPHARYATKPMGMAGTGASSWPRPSTALAGFTTVSRRQHRFLINCTGRSEGPGGVPTG